MKIVRSKKIESGPEIVAAVILDPRLRKEAILAGMSTRDIVKDIVKVKSSNVWGYTINIKDAKSGFGDVYVQFKGKNGGPDDIYVYYDVPVRLFRKWHTAPSKGHFFWQNIRNNFKYAKLTGDKRTKLKNGITTS